MTNQNEKDIEMLRKHLNELGEHFDSVQLFVTRHEPEIEQGTITLQMGIGNWFARYGQVTEWVIKKNESARMDERRAE